MATRPDLASPSRSAPTKEALESAPFPFDAPERARELVVALLAEGTADRVPGLQAQTRALAGEVARRIEQEGVVYAQAATRTLIGALAKKCVRALGAALGRPATAAELAEAQSRLDGQVAGLRLEHDFLVLLVDPARRARLTKWVLADALPGTPRGAPGRATEFPGRSASPGGGMNAPPGERRRLASFRRGDSRASPARAPRYEAVLFRGAGAQSLGVRRR